MKNKTKNKAAQELAHKRWDKKPKKYRQEVNRMLNEARKKKFYEKLESKIEEIL